MSDERHPDGGVSVEQDGAILKIGLDRPEKYNGLTPKMMRELGDAYTRLDEEPGLWVGVLFGHGPHFTAGLDLPKWTEGMRSGRRRDRDSSERVDPFALGRACRKPIVTAVHGITYTAGIEMMLAGDIVVAADNARFCQMEAKRGIAPLGGAHFRFLSRTGWGNAMYHLMLCDEFDAARALQIGLVQEVVPLGRQVERGLELARLIAANAPLGIQVTKEAALRYCAAAEAEACAMLPEIRARVLASEDAKEGIRSFVERRPAKFQGR